MYLFRIFSLIFIFLIHLFLIFNCSFTSPSCLIIENASEYSIKIVLDKGAKRKLFLDKDEGEMILSYPGIINIDIFIISMGIKESYAIEIDYLMDKKFVFNTLLKNN